MVLPADFQSGTVTGHYVDLLGQPVVGTVTFSMSPKRIIDAAFKTIIVPVSKVVTLDGTGSMSVDLPATDDPDVVPSGFTYQVVEAFNPSGGQSYSIPVPKNTVTDLSAVIAISPSNGGTIMAGPPGPPGPGGGADPGAFPVADYGTLTTATTSTAALNAAIAAAQAVGGGTVALPRAGLTINASVTIPDGVALRGFSTTPGTRTGSQIRCTGATAKLIFAGYGATSGDFNIDGTSGGDPTGLIQLQLMDGRHFTAISVSKAPGIGWLIEQAQNCQFDLCTAYHCVTDGFVFDRGCGGLLFNRIESAGSGQDGLSFKANSGGPYGQPTHITFAVGDIEYKNTVSGTFRNLLRMMAGSDIVFDHVRFGGIDVNGSDSTGGAVGHAIHIENAELRLRDSYVAGNSQTVGVGANLIYAKNSFLYLSGRNVFLLAPTLFTFDTSVGGWAERYDSSQVTTEFTLLNSANTTAFNVAGPTGAVVYGPTNGAFDFNIAIWQHFILVVNANSTCNAVPVGRNGQRITITPSQTSPVRTFAWPSNCRFAGAGTGPTIPATSGQFMSVTFAANGANWDEVGRAG